MSEKTYPIYSFSAKWSEKGDTEKYKDYPNWTVGLPEGRIWNSSDFTKMFKEDQSQESLDAYLKDWWDKYILLDKNKDNELELLYLKVEFKERESWNLTWFSHETFDIGQTDEEVLDSFEQFVSRRNSDQLMGAEDRWLWSGAPDKDGNATPAPCRCEHCKAQGLIRINH